MKLLTPRRLLTLDALFARRGWARAGAEQGEGRKEGALDTRMPDDADVRELQALAGAHRARLAAEMALQEGAGRQYAPRGESQVVEARREVG
ncbi:MAG: hypothetical protein ACT6S0_22045 [Roseateles sp.]|uniref:hypothetical protein n=1 Tax=Roseateles sp. TaxID=1971397 RepID=UPI004036B318